ncbi:sugar phosphate nucleotidyltransferase [Bacillus cereus]|uniref:sugar phosphate nucleotidyltransferase n=1 Tax=Bacillus cereus group TaxID=86661 RepID=UPI00080F5EAB|nr:MULTISPECIES: sugar phosphate nucleotidyltransferase [Bacillus cereus group]ANV74402.1 hypothetical protein BCM43_28560 [Bacillus thuringiensis]MCU7756971.1 sugar phosphate nucleotidyltransferase [Bacillus cereus]MDA2627318.1 sugar phosphate nucleotidyltransferase [Bacillus cereus]MDC7752612.1 sugar phosphate nucleotidyltransferase [Bacillus cereus]PFD09612.1 hypothetical protein CN295_22400 [Bacillus cereus]
MKKEEIAVIIPCGGIGKRLNLPYPKPLLMLNYNKALIDYSFDLILKCPFQIRVIVILNKENLQVVEYLEKYKDKFKIVFIYQESGLTEMIGAVKSAQDLFLQHNILLLPDTIIETKSPDQDIISQSIQLLKRQDAIFWIKYEKNQKILAREGAVEIFSNNEELFVRKYIDKPSNLNSSLNGYWAAFGFNKRYSNEFLEMMDSAINNKEEINMSNKLTPGIPAIEVKESYDLGVWEAVHQYYQTLNCE